MKQTNNSIELDNSMANEENGKIYSARAGAIAGQSMGVEKNVYRPRKGVEKEKKVRK